MALKVLTVDDSKMIRTVVAKAFGPYDCEIFEGENGVEGLSIAARENPDLIVLDITMPVMNGDEMLEKLKGQPSLKDIPVIMLTAESGKENVMNIAKLGISDYIVKPFKGEQLIERATKIVNLQPRDENDSAAGASTKYFSLDNDIHILVLPLKITKPIVVEVEDQMRTRIKEMAKLKHNKFVLDLSKATYTNMLLMKLIISIIESCRKSGIRHRVVGPSKINDELKGFHETSDIQIDETIDEAKAKF
jgi:CheY-like chemotaxis protein/anti-anti-sigma regulatory factor